MGFFDWLGNIFGGPRRGSYNRLVAWIETKYGKIQEDWSQSRLTSFMNGVLSSERKKVKEEKKISGLRKYVESGKYKGLVKDGK